MVNDLFEWWINARNNIHETFLLQILQQVFEAKATGLSSPLGILWDSTVATPYDDASQDIIKGFVGSKCTNNSADGNNFLCFVKGFLLSTAPPPLLSL